MKGGWGNKLAAGTACLSVFGAAIHMAAAQEGRPGLEITGSVVLRSEINDNGSLDDPSPGTDTTFGTDLEFGVRSETAASLLELSFGGTLQSGQRAGRSDRSGFVEPFGTLDFRTESATSRLAFDASYRRRDLEDLVDALDEDFIDEDLERSSGKLGITNLGATLDIGIDGPVEGTLAYRRDDRNYSDTSNRDFFDRTTETIRLTGQFAISPTAKLRIFASNIDYDAEDDERTNRTTQTLGVGVLYDINPVLTFDGEISAQQVDEDTVVNGRPVSDDNDGVGLDAVLTRDLPNGALRLTALHEVDAQTSRSEFRVGRDMEFPAATLSVDVGVSTTEDGDPNFVGSLAYRKDLPKGVFDASFVRSALVNDDDEERVRSIASIAYTHELTSVSNLRLGLDFAQSENQSSVDDSTTTNADFEITYIRQLTEDWDWQVGYRGRYRDETNGDSAHSNALIASIGRRFSLRP